jgi:hypothetical protein
MKEPAGRIQHEASLRAVFQQHFVRVHTQSEESGDSFVANVAVGLNCYALKASTKESCRQPKCAGGILAPTRHSEIGGTASGLNQEWYVSTYSVLHKSWTKGY